MASSSRAREAAAQFDALLLGVAFKPLATALGFYGELVVGNASQAVARAERGGLTDRLERLIADGEASEPSRTAGVAGKAGIAGTSGVAGTIGVAGTTGVAGTSTR